MKPELLIALFAGVLVSAGTVRGQSAADSTAIRGAALDYLEGWEHGDSTRMSRSLHPDLVKRAVMGDMTEMGKTDLEAMISRKGYSDESFDGSDQVRILDIFQDIATVRVAFAGWVDHVQVARLNSRWQIVNVLWQPRQ